MKDVIRVCFESLTIKRTQTADNAPINEYIHAMLPGAGYMYFIEDAQAIKALEDYIEGYVEYLQQLKSRISIAE